MDVTESLQRALAGIDGYVWALQVFGVVLATLIAGSVARRFVVHLIGRSRTTHNILDDALFDALLGPTRGLIWVVGFALAAHIAGRETDAAIFDAVPALRDVGVIGALTWFLLRFARSYEDHYVEQQKTTDSQVDQTAKVSSSRPLHHLPTSLCLSLPLSARPICNCRRRRQMTLPGVVCTIWYLSGLSNGPVPPHSAPDPVHRVQRALHPLQGTCERVIRLRMPCT